MATDNAHSYSETQRQLFEEHLRDLNSSGVRAAGILLAILVPLFSILDWFIVREYFFELVVIRLTMAISALVVVILSYTGVGKKYISALSVYLVLVGGLGIVVMIHLHEGYRSPYYAGLMLVILGAGVLMRWRLLQSIVSYSVIYLAYISPSLFQNIEEAEILISNNFFLLSTIIIICVAQNKSYGLLRSEFFSGLALEEAYNRLKELDRLKSEFFSNITHELRTPLTMILSPLEGIMGGEMGRFSPSQRSYFQPIWRNALKLLKLINDLLDLVKIEEKYLRLRVEPHDPTALLNEIVEHSRPLAARKQVKLELELHSAPADLHIDIEKMERVLINLVSNALKFTGAGGVVTISLEVVDGEVQVGVRDTGIGIPEQMQDQIFGRFSQVDGSVARRYGGTGIGLALAREIVELHGGEITVKSEEGKGSLFVIHLKQGKGHFAEGVLDRRRTSEVPVVKKREEDREPREWTRQLLERKDYRFLDIEEVTERRLAEREDEASRATKVLVVEDNVEVLRFVHLQLSDEHAVYLARDGVHGLELARRELPDVIVSDYMMPEMDGLTMLKELRADIKTADIPVIMLTAKIRVEDRLEAREAGADIYLSKPFSPRELRTAVRQLLERRGRQATAVMREHVKSLEVISAGLAHEIHNPLSRIRSSFVVISEKLEAVSRSLKRADLAIEQKEQLVLETMARVERMRDIASGDIKRIEQVVRLVRRYAREGYPEEPTPIPLDETVRDVSRLVAPAEGQEINIELDLRAPGVHVRCIPEEMQQVIRNLWQNAMDAVEPGGHVRVSTRRQEQSAVLEVVDDGHGIGREDLRRIFTPFFTTKDPGKGMGLGLAIAHQVVSQAGGVISVQSLPGKGTTFRVQLPIHEPPEASPPSR